MDSMPRTLRRRPEIHRTTRRERMGDIGQPVRHIEIEPVPHSEPVHEPAPVSPETVPA